MATINYEETYTVSDAADRFDRTTARIRQICIEYEIGTLIEGRIRILTPADVRKIGEILAECGRKKS